MTFELTIRNIDILKRKVDFGIGDSGLGIGAGKAAIGTKLGIVLK